jgi:hypothetical protein
LCLCACVPVCARAHTQNAWQRDLKDTPTSTLSLPRPPPHAHPRCRLHTRARGGVLNASGHRKIAHSTGRPSEHCHRDSSRSRLGLLVRSWPRGPRPAGGQHAVSRGGRHGADARVRSPANMVHRVVQPHAHALRHKLMRIGSCTVALPRPHRCREHSTRRIPPFALLRVPNAKRQRRRTGIAAGVCVLCAQPV